MSDDRYEVCIRNLPFGQAQALFRVLADLGDDERLYGSPGMNWSANVPSSNGEQRHVLVRPWHDPVFEG